jgi:exosortase/archaeosortase
MKNKIQCNTRHKFPYSSKQPQFLTVPDDWEKWVLNYSSLESMAKSAKLPELKNSTKTKILKACTDIESLYGTNPKMMGIAKLRKKYRRLMTSFPKTQSETNQ